MYISEIKFFDPHKIALSGQAFRFSNIDETHVEVVAMGKYLQIATLEDNRFAFSCTEDEFNTVWRKYFDLELDYDAVKNSIDANDSYLKAAADYGYGIRILNQETFETVISYIISQRRSIPSITTCVNRISEACGTVCEKMTNEDRNSGYFANSLSESYYAFPTPEQLKAYLESGNDLSSIGLGYRLPYVISATNDFITGKLTTDLLNSLNDDNLYAVLTSMFGVGTKVANCIMLFSMHRLSRFPIDVWIQRILDKYYSGKFDTTLYPDTAGIMQQFMFFYERLEESHK